MRVLKRVLKILVLAAVIGAAIYVTPIVVVFIQFLRQDHSPFDYGPLKPKAVAAPKSTPTSSVTASGFVVECYGPAGQPIVMASRPGKGGPLTGVWQIGPVTMDGKVVDQETGPAEIYRAKRKKTGWVVHGDIGGEHATYYFDGNGKLTEYWISW